eukprot:365417-Chlamydomonas_euryale.AAC.7
MAALAPDSNAAAWTPATHHLRIALRRCNSSPEDCVATLRLCGLQHGGPVQLTLPTPRPHPLSPTPRQRPLSSLVLTSQGWQQTTTTTPKTMDEPGPATDYDDNGT